MSVARAKGMNRTNVNNYFKILQEILFENDLLDKPQNVSDMAKRISVLSKSQGKLK
jgi:hypothetical protein